jgi:hypothetical protein
VSAWVKIQGTSQLAGATFFSCKCGWIVGGVWMCEELPQRKDSENFYHDARKCYENIENILIFLIF